MATSLITCPKCGAVYERTEVKLRAPEKGDFTCGCSEVIEAWDGSSFPTFRKIKDGAKAR